MFNADKDTSKGIFPLNAGEWECELDPCSTIWQCVSQAVGRQQRAVSECLGAKVRKEPRSPSFSVYDFG